MRVLILSADRFEESELLEPLHQLEEKGLQVTLAAPQRGVITGKHGHKVHADLALDSVVPEEYELLLLPGGKAPAQLQKNVDAVAIARHFLLAAKPVAAICHGPQVLIATGLLAGRSATCYRSMRAEMEAAGVHYLDRKVVVDGNLITSRQPADLAAFIEAIFNLIGT
jgi:protease I